MEKNETIIHCVCFSLFFRRRLSLSLQGIKFLLCNSKTKITIKEENHNRRRKAKKKEKVKLNIYVCMKSREEEIRKIW